ncbi:MAG: hypothetical protein ABH877_01505, partial [bacterium]
GVGLGGPAGVSCGGGTVGGGGAGVGGIGGSAGGGGGAGECMPGYHLCPGGCVADDHPDSCGSSCIPCPTPANGSAACAAGTCDVVCNPGYHPEGAVCAPNCDYWSCAPGSRCDGTICVPCPIGDESEPNDMDTTADVMPVISVGTDTEWSATGYMCGGDTSDDWWRADLVTFAGTGRWGLTTSPVLNVSVSVYYGTKFIETATCNSTSPCVDRPVTLNGPSNPVYLRARPVVTSSSGLNEYNVVFAEP